MSTMSAADPWQQTGRPGNRSYPSGRIPRLDREVPGDRASRRPDVPPLPRSRPVDRHDSPRAPRRPGYGDSGEIRRAPAARPSTAQPARRRTAAAETGGSKLRGILAVVAMFFLTLAAAALESFVGTGLGTVTLIALVLTSALATLLVRRRDVFSVMVAPPLVYVAVALADIALAPSATFSLATLATLLIRGFPAMGIATVVALVIGLIRLAARR